MDNYLLLKKKQELFSFPCFFQFIVYGKTHKMKLLRL